MGTASVQGSYDQKLILAYTQRSTYLERETHHDSVKKLKEMEQDHYAVYEPQDAAIVEPEILAQIHLVHHVVYSPVYQVPVLYFIARRSGELEY